MTKAFDKYMKWLNPATISFSLIDLLLGILALSYANLMIPAVLTSTTTLLLIVSVFTKYKSLKKKATEIGQSIDDVLGKYIKLDKVYGTSSIIVGAVDVFIGLLAILSTSIAIVGVFSSTIKVIVIGGKVIHFKKAQNLARTVSFASLIYISVRKKNYLLGVKNMFKKVFSILNSNKISLLLSGTGIAAMVDAVLGSPALNELLALIGVATLPIWAVSLIYVGVLLLAVIGIKWERVEEFLNRIELKTKEIQKLREKKEKERQENELREKALKSLAEKQKKEIEQEMLRLKQLNVAQASEVANEKVS